jgi:hypothetical protein
VLPAGAGVEVGGEPTAAADAAAGVGVEVDRWSHGVHRPVLRRSTTRWSSHSLSLLGFLMGADGIVCDHDIAHKLWKCPSCVDLHALL